MLRQGMHRQTCTRRACKDTHAQTDAHRRGMHTHGMYKRGMPDGHYAVGGCLSSGFSNTFWCSVALLGLEIGVACFKDKGCIHKGFKMGAGGSLNIAYLGRLLTGLRLEHGSHYDSCREVKRPEAAVSRSADTLILPAAQQQTACPQVQSERHTSLHLHSCLCSLFTKPARAVCVLCMTVCAARDSGILPPHSMMPPVLCHLVQVFSPALHLKACRLLLGMMCQPIQSCILPALIAVTVTA